ncbi:MAG TPA: hypothetical protein VF070_25520 [Streptosporangiaceae bacterium]
MSSPAAEPGLTPLDLLARQQETIEQLAATVALHQRQIEALWRRVQDLEGVPLPDTEPPS